MKIERIEATSEGMPERIRLTAGAAVAEVVPSAGMAMVSLTVEGREHLAMPAELTEFIHFLSGQFMPRDAIFNILLYKRIFL